VEGHPVDNAASTAHRRGHLDRVAGQIGIWVIRGRAGQQTTRMQIQHRSQEELAFAGGFSVMSPDHFTFGAGAVKSR
jgi:hypothetical protein